MQAATQSDKVQDIQTLQESIRVEACKVLPFVNALTECDNTSSFLEKLNRPHSKASLSLQSCTNGLSTLAHPKMSAKKI